MGAPEINGATPRSNEGCNPSLFRRFALSFPVQLEAQTAQGFYGPHVPQL